MEAGKRVRGQIQGNGKDHAAPGKQVGEIALFDSFVYDDRKYVVLQHAGNMTEVKEQGGRHWAWPDQARVNVGYIFEGFRDKDIPRVK